MGNGKNKHYSTTEWLYDVYDSLEEINWYEKEGFRLRYLNVHFFFDAPDEDFLKPAVPLMQVLGEVMEKKLAGETDLFPPAKPANPEYFANYTVLSPVGAPKFSAFRFLEQCTTIANAIDPLDWRSFKVDPDYLRDFMQYGFCVWTIEKV